MTDYVLAHGGEGRERERMALLERFHGPLTVEHLEGLVQPGWRCLEAGAGGGEMTTWLAERVGPGGSVLAVDLETHWLDALRSDVIDVRALDVTTETIEGGPFDLVLARMLLLHLPDPLAACCRLLATARDGATVVIQDADFSPLALEGASAVEQEGLRTMTDVMAAAGVDLAFGPRLPGVLEAAGAEIVNIESSESPGRSDGLAARICVLTIERFRERSLSMGASPDAIDAAIAGLQDPGRAFTGPTQWIVHAHARS